MKDGIEIVISTYNRAPILMKWLELNYDKLSSLGFALAVYDSSTVDETEILIADLNIKYSDAIKYVRVPATTRIDDKVLMGIIESEYEYVWPIGDSRKVDFDEVERKVVPFYKENFDFMCIWQDSGKNNDGRIYYDAVTFFEDCFWHATWLGGIIFKQSIFDSLKDSEVKNAFLKKYYRDDSFSYLGIFYDLIAKKEIRASMSFIHIEELAKNKKPGWLSRYLDVWCGNLCYLMDTIDDAYNSVKAKALRETWEVLGLDGVIWCYAARKAGGLRVDSIAQYDKLGCLDRVTDKKEKIYHYATISVHRLRLLVYITRIEKLFRAGVKYIFRRIKKLGR